jgi:hypothetical protein
MILNATKEKKRLDVQALDQESPAAATERILRNCCARHSLEAAYHQHSTPSIPLLIVKDELIRGSLGRLSQLAWQIPAQDGLKLLSSSVVRLGLAVDPRRPPFFREWQTWQGVLVASSEDAEIERRPSRHSLLYHQPHCKYATNRCTSRGACFSGPERDKTSLAAQNPPSAQDELEGRRDHFD